MNLIRRFIQTDEKIKNYIYMLMFVDAATFITTYRGWVRSYNTTMLALSYEYGFTSRSLIGTLYHLLDRITPIDMMQYEMVRKFAFVITVLFIIYIVYFSYKCLVWNKKDVSDGVLKVEQYILLAFNIAVVATFTYAYNYLRVDFCMIWMTLLGLSSLMNKRTEWMSLIFAALGVMFHQGYVLMYFNAILIIQFYYWLTRKNLKNAILFISTFITGSGLFLWFELFSRSNGTAIFEKVQREASNLSYQGIYHTTLLYHEVLGIDVSGAETDFVYRNHVQLIVYVVILIPVIYSLFRSFYRIVKKANGWIDKLKYIGLAVGSLTIVPDMLLKIDYGRWIMAVVVYYMMSILILLVLGDQLIVEEACYMVSRIKGKPWLLLYFTIVVLAVPYMDVDIDAIARNVQRFMETRGILFY